MPPSQCYSFPPAQMPIRARCEDSFKLEIQRFFFPRGKKLIPPPPPPILLCTAKVQTIPFLFLLKECRRRETTPEGLALIYSFFCILILWYFEIWMLHGGNKNVSFVRMLILAVWHWQYKQAWKCGSILIAYKNSWNECVSKEAS